MVSKIVIDPDDGGITIISRNGRPNAERFNYEPSLVISVLAVAIFSIALVLYVWQVVRYRTWWLIIMVWAVVVETAGYVLRMIVSYEILGSNLLAVDFFLIISAPSFIFVNYFTFGVLLASHLGWPPSISRASIVALIPLQLCNVVVLILLSLGGMLFSIASSRGLFIASSKILFGGLCIQCFCILGFCICYGHFCLRVRHLLRQSDKKLKLFVLIIWLSTILIFMRTLFRLAQLAEGIYGELRPNKTLFALFEFTPMVIVTYLLAIWFPTRCVPTFRSLSTASHTA